VIPCHFLETSVAGCDWYTACPLLRRVRMQLPNIHMFVEPLRCQLMFGSTCSSRCSCACLFLTVGSVVCESYEVAACVLLRSI